MDTARGQLTRRILSRAAKATGMPANLGLCEEEVGHLPAAALLTGDLVASSTRSHIAEPRVD
jgi:hypothetical protein